VCAEERPTLRPLPVEPFRYYRFGDRTVRAPRWLCRSRRGLLRCTTGLVEESVVSRFSLVGTSWRAGCVR
jgi:hypothetical protein